MKPNGNSVNSQNLDGTQLKNFVVSLKSSHGIPMSSITPVENHRHKQQCSRINLCVLSKELY